VYWSLLVGDARINISGWINIFQAIFQGLFFLRRSPVTLDGSTFNKWMTINNYTAVAWRISVGERCHAKKIGEPFLGKAICDNELSVGFEGSPIFFGQYSLVVGGSF